MKVDGKPMRTIWLEPDGWGVEVIDQTRAAASIVTAPFDARRMRRMPSAPCWCAARR